MAPGERLGGRNCASAVAVALFLAVLVASETSSSRQYTRTIYVDPERGSNTETCVKESSVDQPCKNLSYVFQPQYRESSTRYSLQPGTHYLNSTASDHPFTGLTDIAITGNTSGSSSVTIFCFTENAGFSFNGVYDVTLQNLTISGCASLQNSTSRNYSSSSQFSLSLTRVAVYFNSCENLVLDTVKVANSPGATGVIIYNTNGTNIFTNCNFSANVGNPEDVYPGGGGMYVEFSYCLPGVNECETDDKIAFTDRNKNSIYSFSSCTFSYNEAETSLINSSTLTFIVPFRSNHVAFGRGGGLSIYLNGDAANNSFTVTQCTFSNNRAKYGAGMFLEFHDNSTENNVTVKENTRFVGNNCSSGGVAGGGMRLAHYVFNGRDSDIRNTVELSSATFLNNYAGSGGGLSISPSLQNSPESQLFSVVVEDTGFVGNHAPYGAALRIDLFGLIVDGKKPNVNITNCVFFDNTVYAPVYTKPVEVGLGVVYISGVDVYITDSLFTYNKGSALALVTSSIYFLGENDFFSNRGIDGGAIALFGSSSIVIDRGISLHFEGNRVTNRGGAIFNEYADKNDYKNNPQCFVVHRDPFICPDDWGAVFEFAGNYDSQGLNSIYSTSILPCALSGGPAQEQVQQILCWKNWTYTSNGTNDSCSNHIHTGPGYIREEISTPYTPFRLSQQEDNNISAYSGQNIPLHYVAYDDLNHTVQVAYIATVTNSTSSSYTGAKLDPYYTYVTQNLFRVYQYKNTGTSVTVDLDEVGDRAWHIEVDIDLGDCPAGLQPTHIACDSSDMEELCITCQCNTDASYGEIVHCLTNYSASLQSDCWIGRVPGRNNVTEFAAGVCPPGFCRSSESEFSPIPEEDLNGHLCGPQHRKGVLCGECMEHHGVALNMYECVPCNISNHQIALHATYYVLSVYVPLFLLFLVIIVFNIKLTTGSANAFILFSQVISSTFDIDRMVSLGRVVHHVDRYLSAQRFIYGLSNLEFFENFIPSQHFCLGTSLNVLDLLLIDYTVAFAPLLMILVVVLLYKTNCCCCLRSSCRNSGNLNLQRAPRWLNAGKIKDAVLPAFASFVLLSYTKFCLISSYLTVPQSVYDSSGKGVGSDRVFYAGQFSVTDKTYLLYYKAPAIFVFLTFVTIPPLLLLKYPLLIFEKIIGKINCFQRYYPKAKIHILLDTFQGCYKDRYRWFAGLYFLFRLLINLNYTFAELFVQYMLQGIFCIILALLVAYLKPYRNQFHVFNYVDSLMFLNLAVINQIIFYIYASTRQGKDPSVAAFAVQYILVLLPLVYMVVYMMWRVLPIPRVRTRVREWLETRRHNHQMENLIQNDEKAETPDDVDWERARAINKYKPLKKFPGDPEGPLHSSISRPISHTRTESVTDCDPSTISTTADSSRQGYGSTDSGVTLANGRPT